MIPISDISAKDDFQAIKGQTRDDQLAAYRVPPQLKGIIPNNTNTGGFGDIEKAAAVFVANELEPLQETLSEFNAMIGQEVIRFAPFIAPTLYRYLGRPRGGFFRLLDRKSLIFEDIFRLNPLTITPAIYQYYMPPRAVGPPRLRFLNRSIFMQGERIRNSPHDAGCGEILRAEKLCEFMH